MKETTYKPHTFTSIDEAFPKIELGEEALGDHVVVQLKKAPKQTKSGIYLAVETQESEEFNNTIGRIISMGPECFQYFCDKTEMNKPWPGGAWYKLGDFVRIQRHGGQRIQVGEVPCQILKAKEIVSLVLDPLKDAAL